MYVHLGLILTLGGTMGRRASFQEPEAPFFSGLSSYLSKSLRSGSESIFLIAQLVSSSISRSFIPKESDTNPNICAWEM